MFPAPTTSAETKTQLYIETKKFLQKNTTKKRTALLCGAFCRLKLLPRHTNFYVCLQCNLPLTNALK